MAVESKLLLWELMADFPWLRTLSAEQAAFNKG
jgi:hypothetical protein